MSRSHVEYPVEANGTDGDFGQVKVKRKVIHSGSETWRPGWILEAHGAIADTLIEWAGSNAPVAVLSEMTDVSTVAALATVSLRGIFNTKFMCVEDKDTRPTQAQIKLLTTAGLIPTGGEHA